MASSPLFHPISTHTQRKPFENLSRSPSFRAYKPIPTESLCRISSLGEYPKWIDSIAAVDRSYGIDTQSSELRVYIAAFYFCSYTMTSVGYGDIGPQQLDRLNP